MSEDSPSEFPPAPELELESVPAKKRATKKAATAKTATKKAAKTATKKKAPRTLAAVAALNQPQPEAVPEPTPVEPIAPVVEVVAAPAPVAEIAEAPAKPKRASTKKAKAKVVADEPAVEAAAVTALSMPEPEPPAQEALAAVAPAEAVTTASAESRDAAAEPASDEGEAAGGEGGDRPQRRLRWWEKRKLDRAARAAARAGGGGGGAPAPQQAPSEGQPVRHKHGERERDQRGDQREQREQRGDQREQRDHAQGRRGQPAEANDQDDDRQSPAITLGPPEPAEGILELSLKGHGFLRLKDKGWAQLVTDVFVHGEVIRKNGLRDGMYVKGQAQRGHRGMQLTEVSEANGRKPEELRDLPLFEELKAVNPSKRYQLETRADRMTTRVVDMMTPVGRGQRGLIVAPPRAGKTTMLQHIAEAMIQNYPQVHLMILLVDERPEEVTEFKRSLPQAEIFASNNDQDVKSHTRIAQLAIERAKRLVEQGDHVFILMDSITRLARAFNNMNKNGATMSGGMGVGSMEIPRRLFAAARNTRTAGSLTILATALIETGSRMDDMIFLEFKGTGNMELVLDRKIAEQYIFPAVNIFKSGTRREELLLQPFQIEKIHFLRRGLAGHKPIEAVQRVLSLLERYPNNAQMLTELSSKDR